MYNYKNYDNYDNYDMIKISIIKIKIEDRN